MDARQRLNRNKNKKQPKNQRSVKKKGARKAGPVVTTGGRKKTFAGTKPAARKGVQGKKKGTKGATAQPTKTLTRKISDLRQIITTRPAKQTISQKKSAIKQRLGLQSSSARERIRNTNAAAPAARKAIRSAKAVTLGGSQPARRHQVSVPTVIFTPSTSAATAFASTGSRATGYSVVVSNLNPAVTQSDILELFGDVGAVSSYQSINSTTSMVTYSSPQEASIAVQTYNNRFLDGQPMQVTLIPSPSAASETKRVSQTFRRVFSRSR